MRKKDYFGRGYPLAMLSVCMEMRATTRDHGCLKPVWIILTKKYAYSVKSSFFPQNSVQANSMAIESSYCLHMKSFSFFMYLIGARFLR